jgi:hypothetical protein
MTQENIPLVYKIPLNTQFFHNNLYLKNTIGYDTNENK